ncbi:MAG: LOG family protein [Methylococcales bacterium]|nr:LOG family protein [Methylococcales bacterium]
MTKKTKILCESPFSTAKEDAAHVLLDGDTVQTRSSSYRLAYDDFDFMMRDELRPVRLQLELLKPELAQAELGIKSTVVIFGSARIHGDDEAKQALANAEQAWNEHPDELELANKLAIARRILTKSYYYDEARKLGALITSEAKKRNYPLLVVTGGGLGIMEAANHGAADVGGNSMGLNIVLPHEQHPNPYITPELCFQFHYFAIRKMHFLMRAIALVAFPGGFGTMDELFKALTLIQTKKVKRIPVILFGQLYWEKIINFDALVEEGAITPCDRELMQYAETAEQAWQLILKSNSSINNKHSNNKKVTL